MLRQLFVLTVTASLFLMKPFSADTDASTKFYAELVSSTERTPNSCGGDPNAKPGCGTNCNKQCSYIGGKIKPCPLYCKLNGCDCKDGFYFNNNKNTCVLPKDCS